MAALFRRDKPIVPEFVVPLAELPESAAQKVEIARIDQRLEAFRLIPRPSRTADARRLVDFFLDKRLFMRPARPGRSLRPVVPVTPGRPS